MSEGSAASQRVWEQMPAGARELLCTGLSPSDLQTLLLFVAQERAASVTPSEVLRRWSSDRFVRPAASDPRWLSQVEARIWSAVPVVFEGVELSPVAPLGTTSALAAVSQHRVLTTMRRSEVVSDSTNALAVEAAARRARTRDAVHLAACLRQLRAQDFGEGRSAHFRLMTLVSTAADQGSGRAQADLLLLHLGAWTDVLREVLPRTSLRVEVTAWDRVLKERLHGQVLPNFPVNSWLSVVEDGERNRARNYYSLGALRIVAQTLEGDLELGDGGFTDWTAKLTQNKKEMCLISCLATERVASLAREAADGVSGSRQPPTGHPSGARLRPDDRDPLRPT